MMYVREGKGASGTVVTIGRRLYSRMVSDALGKVVMLSGGP